MLSRCQNPQQGSIKPYKLSIGTTTQNPPAPSSANLEVTDRRLVLSPVIAPVITYIKEELQKLLTICMDAK